MSDIAIKVENLSKRYRIGLKEELHDTFAGALTDFLRQPVKNMRRLRRLTTFSDDGHDAEDIIWALKDVSFEVKRGEVVGIIGRNGAGKSTLLKILSRITHPTSGRVTLNGRVSSLLEVGTGFHPELTGRENIYLNGTILGMTRAEIDKKFDEIVDFSGVEKFIDTPVKRYSSGMRVRLAFSVAAHLEPEILLIDEVLAVGDIEFQKKCLGKMKDVAGEGRTVLFVSHNMGAVISLCQWGLLLNGGLLQHTGPMDTCVQKYLSSTKSMRTSSLHIDLEETTDVQLTSVSVISEDGDLLEMLPHDYRFQIEIEVYISMEVSGIYIAVHIHDQNLETILFSRDFESNIALLQYREPGLHKYRLHVPGSVLVPGEYTVSVHLVQKGIGFVSRADHACGFRIIDHGSIRARMGFPWHGKLAIPLEWEEVDFRSIANKISPHDERTD